MKLDKFDALPRTADGRPVITLMTDPDMSGPTGFLSLVDRGANGRRIAVVKAEDLPPPASPQPTTPVQKVEPSDELTGLVPAEVDHGQKPGQLTSWFRTLFSGLFGRDQATKGDAISFDAAVAIPLVFERLYQGTDALHHAVATILHDESISDKRAAIEVALAQFQRFVASAFDLPNLSAEQAKKCAVETATLWERAVARKRAASMSSAHALALGAALPAMQQALSALEALTTSPSSQTQASKASTDPETPMKIEQLSVVAKAAGEQAILVAKIANPQATPAELQQVGVAAVAQVFKEAVQGPAQPGIPTTVLADQLGESAGMNGNAKDPMGQLTAAINRMTQLTSKMAVHLGMDPATGDAATLAADGSNAGLLHVVQKQGEALQKLAQKVAGERATPRPSAQGGEQPAPVDDAAKRQLATKAEGDAFNGSALGGWTSQ